MARYEVTGPDGGRYEITAPDTASEQEVLSYLQQQVGQPQPDQTPGRFSPGQRPGLAVPEANPVADVAKSAGVGLARGALGMAGLPGTVEQLGRMGINAGARALGAEGNVVSPETALPTGGDLQKRVEGVTGKFYEPQTTAGEYARTVGEFAPGALFPGGMAQRVLGNVVGPAVASEAAGQLTEGTSLEPYARVGGALVGGGLPNMGARALTPAPSSATRQGHVQRLQNEGVTDLTAGQITGANPLRWMEGAVQDTPLTGARLPNMLENQAEQFTQAALRRAGVNAPRATQDVIDAAFTAQGQRFDNLANASTLVLNRVDRRRMANALQGYARLTPPSQRAPVIAEFFQDVDQLLGQQVPGRVYQRYRSMIETAARQATDPALREGLRTIRNVLDDAVERGLPPNQRGQWQQARDEYRNLLVISRASAAAGENAANGLISPAQLASATKGVQGSRNFERGRGELQQLARAGEAVMKQMPQSGTAPRLMAMQIGQGLAGAAGGSYVGGGDPTMTGLGALAPFLFRGAAGRALMSRPAQQYFANQALPGAAVNARESALASLVPAIIAANSSRPPPEVTVYPPGDPRNEEQ